MSLRTSDARAMLSAMGNVPAILSKTTERVPWNAGRYASKTYRDCDTERVKLTDAEFTDSSRYVIRIRIE